jgi:hypothetical protein
VVIDVTRNSQFPVISVIKDLFPPATPLYGSRGEADTFPVTLQESRMATIIPLAAGPTLVAAAQEFLSRRDLDADTVRSYRQTLQRLQRELGEQSPLTALTPAQTAAAFTSTWNGAAARTWNRHRSALRSLTVWAGGRWPIADLVTLI